MSIWIDKNSRILVQGMTGKYGQYHTRMMLEYGSNIVAGVTPGKGGEKYWASPFLTVSKKPWHRRARM